MQEFISRPAFEWSGYVLLLLGFILSLVIQLVLYRRILMRPLKEPATATKPQRPVSILVCVRNEADRLEGFLTDLLNQNYSNFEIVVIDDFSTDTTLIKLGVMARKYSKIKFSTISQESKYSEKLALSLAIKAAKNDWLLVVTPDSKIDNPNYLATLNEALEDDSDMVVSYINYGNSTKHYNRLCRVERLDAFWRSSVTKVASVPIIFQQGNVLFKRSLYAEGGAFKGQMNAHFAGLELIFNKVKKLKVNYCLEPDATLREEKITDKYEFRELIKKHIRLIAQGGWSRSWPLSFEQLSKLILLVSIIGLLVTEPEYWFVYIPLPFIVLLVHLFLIKSLLKRLAERKIFLSSFTYVFVRPVLWFIYRASLYLQVQRNKWN